jgi:hypothetical protein
MGFVVFKFSTISNELLVSSLSINYFLFAIFFLFNGGIIPRLGIAGD